MKAKKVLCFNWQDNKYQITIYLKEKWKKIMQYICKILAFNYI